MYSHLGIHFRVGIIQADNSGGRNGINIVSMMSSVAYLLELIVRSLLLRTMGSNIIIPTLEEQVDVLDNNNNNKSIYIAPNQSRLLSGALQNMAN